MEINIEGLAYTYMSRTPFQHHALFNIDMHIASGSFVAIIGATGSGKSTLLQLIAGLIRPTKGKIKIGAYQLTPLSKDATLYRRQVGVVFQYPEDQLFEQTVAKDIGFGPTNQGLQRDQVFKRIQLAMSWVGLSSDIANQFPFHLSGGQMRRVAIAGVLAMQPPILILDEPTTGLDKKGKVEILNTIKHLHREKGMTIILVSHNMDEVAQYAEYLFVLSKGHVAFHGPPTDVFSKPKRLRELNLDIPEICKIVNQINQKCDPPLPANILTLNELEQHLILRFREKKL